MLDGVTKTHPSKIKDATIRAQAEADYAEAREELRRREAAAPSVIKPENIPEVRCSAALEVIGTDKNGRKIQKGYRKRWPNEQEAWLQCDERQVAMKYLKRTPEGYKFSYVCFQAYICMLHQLVYAC